MPASLSWHFFMPENIRSLLTTKVPFAAVDFCVSLWTQYPFDFFITPDRKSKLGDYRCYHTQKKYVITINGSPEKLQFLITYLHEVAHHITYLQFGQKVKPHGREWKTTFQHLLVELLSLNVIPNEMKEVYLKFVSNPKATTAGHTQLFTLLKKQGNHSVLFLYELEEGTVFSFKSRLFKKVKIKRTRVLCEEVTTQKQYLIHQSAEVEV